jgi:ACT domain-containing protein
MNAFLVELENKTGELARITEAVAAKGVDITGISGSTCGSSGSVALMTDNDATTRTALQDARVKFRELEATEAAIGTAPGSLAKACRRLADGGVNIEALMPTGMEGDHIMVAFVTSDPTKAREILSHAG